MLWTSWRGCRGLCRRNLRKAHLQRHLDGCRGSHWVLTSYSPMGYPSAIQLEGVRGGCLAGTDEGRVLQADIAAHGDRLKEM